MTTGVKNKGSRWHQNECLLYLDYFFLDDDFNPRGSDDDELNFNPRKSMAENLSPSPEQSFSTSPFPPPTQSPTFPAPPLIDPPRSVPALPPRDPMKISLPAVAGPTQILNNNDKFHSDATFGSNNIFQNNPFDISPPKADPFGMTAFDNTAAPLSKPFPSDDWGMVQKSIAVNSLSLDELDPLKK